MRNRDLQNDLEKISSYDEIVVNIDFVHEQNDEVFYLDVNDNSYFYYIMNHLLEDFMELSKMFDIKILEK